jgi:hypothetical protein
MSTLLEYKIHIAFNIHRDNIEEYYRFVLGEYLPTVQAMGMRLLFVWQIEYGNYPERLLEFACADEETLNSILGSARWNRLEERLQSYTTDYSRKLFYFADRFQL